MAGSEFDTPDFVAHLAAYQDDIKEGDRRIVAIAGPPGSGKTTLAAELDRQLNDTAPGSCVVLPMDGYHYDDEVLTPRGWQARKGAPHTFDVGGLGATLRRLRANEEDSVAVPRFDRTIEIARAGAILIERSVRLIVVEGNWLLLAEAPWDSLVPYFDQTAMIRVGLQELERRNRQRWVDFDYSEAAIRAKLDENDMPNVRLVYERSASPDWIIRP